MSCTTHHFRWLRHASKCSSLRMHIPQVGHRSFDANRDPNLQTKHLLYNNLCGGLGLVQASDVWTRQIKSHIMTAGSIQAARVPSVRCCVALPAGVAGKRNPHTMGPTLGSGIRSARSRRTRSQNQHIIGGVIVLYGSKFRRACIAVHMVHPSVPVHKLQVVMLQYRHGRVAVV
jgi:hypothetical protein